MRLDLVMLVIVKEKNKNICKYFNKNYNNNNNLGITIVSNMITFSALKFSVPEYFQYSLQLVKLHLLRNHAFDYHFIPNFILT